MAPGIRVIIDPDFTGEQNMQTDVSLFERYKAGEGGPVLRLYGWSEATVTIGKFQDRARLLSRIAATAPAHIPIVRRPTGGRAVLHLPGELTYAVVSGSRSGFPQALTEIYSEISSVIIDALSRLGITAHVGRSAANRHEELCFASGTRADIMCETGKLAGSAQVRESGAFLQHGSIVLKYDRVMHEQVFGSGSSDQVAIAGVRDVDESISRSQLVDAFASAARRRWP